MTIFLMSREETVYSNIKTSSYDIPFVVLYIVEGSFITIINIILTARLFSNKNLKGQKEIVLIGSCLFFDIFFGLTYFSAGIYRATVISVYEYFPLVSMWDCFLTPHTQLFILITVMAGIQLLATAIDRFICVFFPFTYLGLHMNYAYFLMFFPYFLVIPLWVPGALGAYKHSEEKTFTMNCLLNQSINVQEYVTYRTIRIVCTLLCVLIYVPIFGKMCINIYSHTKIAPGCSKNGKRLLSMTKTVALITGSTLLLFTVPDIITKFYPFINTNTMYILNLNKGVLNVFILLLTQRGAFSKASVHAGNLTRAAQGISWKKASSL